MLQYDLNIEKSKKLISENRLGEAETVLNLLLTEKPDDLESGFLKVKIHYLKKEYKSAQEILTGLVQIHKNNSILHASLALIQKIRGNITGAIENYSAALKINPADFESHYNFGILLGEENRLEEAIEHFSEAINLNPHFEKAYYNLGNIYRGQKNFEKARENYLRAINIKHNYDEAYYNLGVVSEKVFDYKAAAEYYDGAIEINKNNIEAHWNKALLLLAADNYSEGWKEYEWRLKKREFARPDIKIKKWNEEDLRGKKIFVHWEQGFGDSILFIRFIAVLKKLGAYVIFESKDRIYQLLKSFNFIDEFVIKDQKYTVEADFSVSLLSLPAILKISKNDCYFSAPYLFAETELLNKWAPRFDKNKFNVGIIWQGSAENADDFNRSMQITEFEELFKIPRAKFYSLQFGEKDESIKDFFAKNNIEDLPLAFSETAAVIKNLDLVITVDTVTAHLAGALDVPVWILLSVSPDWRWGRVKNDSHWYKSARLFRQSEAGNWQKVISDVALELDRLVAKRTNEIPRSVNYSQLLKKAIELAGASQIKEADAAFLEASEIENNDPLLFYNWGIAKYKLGDLNSAIEKLRKTIYLKPAFLQARNDLSLIFTENEKPEEAVEILETKDVEKDSQSYFNLGLAFKKLEKFELAGDSFGRAIELNSFYSDAYINMAQVKMFQGKTSEAVKLYIALGKTGYENPDLYFNLGVCCHELGLLEEAEKYFAESLSAEPGNPETHLALAEVLLTRGRFTEGWEEYSWRLKRPEYRDDYPALKFYDGSNPAGKKILVFSEQGYGDSFLFLRFIKELKSRGAYVGFLCDKNLAPLIKLQEYVDEAGENLFGPDFDFKIKIASLAGFFVENLNDINNAEYLKAIRRAPLPAKGKKIGLVWRGKTMPVHNRKRHIDTKIIDQIISGTDCKYYSFQMDVDSAEQEFLEKNQITDLTKEITDFSSTAGLIAQMDLFITIDTSLAHLAASMGVETWVLLPYMPDWRWLLHRTDSPWYRSVVLFRQSAPGNWAEPAAKINRKLKGIEKERTEYPDEFYNLKAGLKELLKNKNFEKIEEVTGLLIQKGLTDPEILNLAGIADTALGKYETGLAYFLKSLQSDSASTDLFTNIGINLFRIDLIDEALKYYKKAVETDPSNSGALYNFGVALFETGNFESAEEAFKQTLSLNPDYVAARYNLGIIKLMNGNFQEGFKDYELRRTVFSEKSRFLSGQDWKGESFKNKNLLIFTDQGFGDIIQFSRYLPLVKKLGGRLIFEGRTELERLFKGFEGIDEYILQGDENIKNLEYDFQVPLLSLPGIFKTTLETIPPVPEHFQKISTNKKLLPETGLTKVGIFWRGSKNNPELLHRSCDPAKIFYYLSDETIKLFSLQVDPDENEKRLMEEFKVTDLSGEISDFYDTARIINELDLVVTIDSAVAHLSGSLNKETWLMLPYVPDWRWMRNVVYSPWYPSLKLFRQKEQNNWLTILQEIKEEIVKFSGNRR